MLDAWNTRVAANMDTDDDADDSDYVMGEDFTQRPGKMHTTRTPEPKKKRQAGQTHASEEKSKGGSITSFTMRRPMLDFINDQRRLKGDPTLGENFLDATFRDVQGAREPPDSPSKRGTAASGGLSSFSATGTRYSVTVKTQQLRTHSN